MTRLDGLAAHLRAGKSFRRADVAKWSKSVDRDLQSLVRQGVLKKVGTGLYYRPRRSSFGEVPVTDRDLVRTFLKDERFLLLSPNAYNSLGVGTTQLYNKRVVYNRKRHGEFQLGGRTYDFRMKSYFPLHSVTQEFLLVDLVNNLDRLAEDRQLVLGKVRERALSMNATKLRTAVRRYGKVATRNFFDGVLANCD